MSAISRRSFVEGIGVCAASGIVAVAAGLGDVPPASAQEQRSGQDTSAINDTLDTDIVVVGAGCSGLAACVQAAEKGASVVCIECKDVIGGGAGGIEGMFAIDSQLQKDQGIEVSMGDLIRTELGQSQYRSDSLTLSDMVNASGDDIDWLIGHGVTFGKVDNYVGSYPIFHWFSTGTGAESYITPMQADAESNGVEFILETNVDSLVKADDGSIAGVVASKADGSSLQVNAKAVIIATGGFSERLDCLARFGYTEDNSVSLGMGGSGSGQDMAIACGGKDTRADAAVGGRLFVDGLPSFFAGGYFNSVMNTIMNVSKAVWVNQDGERFMNEDLPLTNPTEVVNPVRRHQKVYILLDEGMMDEYIGGDETATGELQDGIDQGAIFEADDWSGIAAATGMDDETFKKTIDRYNEHCQAGDDSDYGKAKDYLEALDDSGKVYAVRVKAERAKTLGGIGTNRHFCVIDDADKPITGLYATGVDGAMIWANVYPMNISGSCAAHNVYSGRTAANHAIENLL